MISTIISCDNHREKPSRTVRFVIQEVTLGCTKPESEEANQVTPKYWLGIQGFFINTSDEELFLNAPVRYNPFDSGQCVLHMSSTLLPLYRLAEETEFTLKARDTSNILEFNSGIREISAFLKEYPSYKDRCELMRSIAKQDWFITLSIYRKQSDSLYINQGYEYPDTIIFEKSPTFQYYWLNPDQPDTFIP